MTQSSLYQVALYLIIISILIGPLGAYMARVYRGQSLGFNRIENFIYRLCNINKDFQMDWKVYLFAMLAFNLLSIFIVYIFQRLQGILPLNPQNFAAIPSDLAFNIAVSFVTNTDWTAYSGESTLSYFTQMAVLTVQNFLSAATGMAVLIAFIRGITSKETTSLGNFWVDIVRSIMYILLPLSLIISILLVSEGAIQNFNPYQQVEGLQNLDIGAKSVYVLPQGSVASQTAIAILGSNGGGYFNANTAHPFANPTPLTNFILMIAILIIPAAFCHTFGILANDKKQGWAILVAMFVLFIPAVVTCISLEQKGNSAFNFLHVDQHHQEGVTPGGNMEGKELRFGITNSALWSIAATATSNGATSSLLSSFTPLGGMINLWMIQLGEVVFGGVGSGLYSMLILLIITVFIIGLMVGRTPEYLGKKIETFEIQMASLVILIIPLMILIITAIALMVNLDAIKDTDTAGPHALTAILYAFSSMAHNNGSAFAELNANTFFYNTAGGITMLIGRYVTAIAVIAIAGSLAKKKILPANSLTLPTHTPLFICLLVCVVILIGALTFLPVLALGPIAEQIMLWNKYGI